ncbi:hypothetical protein RRG08_019370 [Elysia crispata]|uniref:Uncharacterized protein n=1 Tax=Elysia crispata TaxID=231223 RepID=A0AAE1AV05_9GAST|nr:hypothetical protein RRG08_019370 [Elysia crispata]
MSTNRDQSPCPNKSCVLQEPLSTADMEVEKYVTPPCISIPPPGKRKKVRTPTPDPEIPIKRPAPPPLLPPCTTKAKENPCTGRLG